MEDQTLPRDKWDENHVSSWLKSIGVKDEYIKKLHEAEVTGPVLKGLTRDFLKNETGMKPGQIQLLLSERDKLLGSTELNKPEKKQTGFPERSETQRVSADHQKKAGGKGPPEVGAAKEPSPVKEKKARKEKSDLSLCEPRPFDTEDTVFKYVKNRVLPPETGIKNLIAPCREYKSLDKAVTLDQTRLQAKFAYEVIRFAAGCMNIRTNGTIHFGVKDNIRTDYEHGEIIGLPVKDRDVFVDALDYTERCFANPSHKEDARRCIRPPRFIEVIDKGSTETSWVIEVDVVPMAKTVKGQVYTVRLPKFNEKTNKVEFEKKTVYQRVGANTVPISDDDQVEFTLGMPERDSRREEAELSGSQSPSDIREDLGRKLTLLLTGGKKKMDDSLWYIVVANKCDSENLINITFLHHMNIFCVLDFDPDSKTAGLCGQYLHHHAANLHFLEDYSNESGLNTSDFIKKLQLFDQTSWIFCNGRTDYLGDKNPCDEKTWIKTKKKNLKKAVSIICNEILPKGSFVVLFLLMSQVEQPLVDTFHEFYAEMNGLEDMIVISESKENYTKWSCLAQASCTLEHLNQISIVGMQMSHIDTTVQSIQPLTATQIDKRLAVYNKGQCTLKTTDEERMLSLEIIGVNECDNISTKGIDEEEVKNIERYFYQGGKVSWINFWLADKKKCGEVIQRDAYGDAIKIVDNIVRFGPPQKSVARINIYHHPGSGGSTVARQTLWNKRKDLRCAVVKPSYPVANVCEHAVLLREYEEKDANHCVPVLLLLEDCDEEYLHELRHELGEAVSLKKINPLATCFILLSCKRSHEPEKMLKALPLQTVAVTHKLSEEEKKLFSKKREVLEQKFEPEFILTFVLMSEAFEEQYVKDFVEHLLQDIDRSSLETRLITYVAVLNLYVQNSYISVSHCEAFLGLGVQVEKIRQSYFENALSKQARLVLIHLRESTTFISSVRIIHPLVAQEIVHQLCSRQTQSTIAMAFLHEKVLFEHRFGRDDFLKFVRDLFIRRYKRSKGDNIDTFFSPLIEHVCNVENNPPKAMELLKAAYTCFGKDPFFAQQLARLYYSHEKFEEAKNWAEVAKSHLPHDSFILHTEGQVYKKWFNVKYDALDREGKTAENTAEIIETALQAAMCFRASETAATTERDCMNNSAYFGEVDVCCRLLQLISSVNVFSGENGRAKLLNYLLTEHVPEEIKEPWKKFHSHLKGLQKSIYNALEWISEDLSYFQTDKREEEEEVMNKELEHQYNPRKWLLRKTSVYASFFCEDISDNQDLQSETTDKLTPLRRQMRIYKLGGGNVTTIFSLLSDQKNERSSRKLEQIISMYPEDPQKQKLDTTSLGNYILCQIALGCVSPRSPKLVTLKKLQDLSVRFYKDRNNTSPSSAFFLLTLLFWPDAIQKEEQNEQKNKILMLAITYLKGLYDHKIKNVPSRKKRIYTHFFLGNGKGLDRFVHRSKLEKCIKGTLNERRLKWLSGEVWTTPEVTQLLQRVKGWTENETLYVQGWCKSSKIRVLPLYSASLPHANANVSFYLGFSFDGPVALHIECLK
ncbi:sterile alpha motif domain-containing protein 9-like [Lepisosteus oculatus]|uniref:sterile alpha motif domain-containing protein 9-like n=1 Tax=Lepisosteus oculatus TaxID=7918 RepID=UPI0037144DB4